MRQIRRQFGVIQATGVNLLYNFRTNATWEESATEIVNDGRSFAIILSLAMLVQFIAGILSVDFFNRAATRQITRIRIAYFQSLMRQEVGWYDVFGSNENFAVRITE